MLNPHAPSFEYGSSSNSNNNGPWVGYPYAFPSYPHPSSVYISPFAPYPVAHNWITSYVDHHPAPPPPPPPPFPLPPQRALKLEEIGSQDEESKGRDSRVVKARQRPAHVFSARKVGAGYQVAEATRWVPKVLTRLPNDPFAPPETAVGNGGDVGRACSPRKHAKGTRSRSGAFMVDDQNHHKKERYRTTVMIKNIPNRLKRPLLIKMLDNFCAEVNRKGKRISTSDHSAYDFVYLPIDFHSRCNLGYAFVNFTTTDAACRVERLLHNYKWNFLGSQKVCEIAHARIQGKQKLIKHFEETTFVCDSDEFLPVVFSPPRDGAVSRPYPKLVGKRWHMSATH